MHLMYGSTTRQLLNNNRFLMNLIRFDRAYNIFCSCCARKIRQRRRFRSNSTSPKKHYQIELASNDGERSGGNTSGGNTIVYISTKSSVAATTAVIVVNADESNNANALLTTMILTDCFFFVLGFTVFHLGSLHSSFLLVVLWRHSSNNHNNGTTVSREKLHQRNCATIAGRRRRHNHG